MSNDRFDVRLEGGFTTVTPFTVSTPGSQSSFFLPTIGGRLVIPATTIRGTLRRACRDVVHDLMGGAGFSLDDYFLLTLGGVKVAKPKAGKKDKKDEAAEAGGSAEAESGDDGLDKEALRIVSHIRDKNPQVSLFGAMAPVGISGLLGVDFAIAEDGVVGVSVEPVKKNEFRHVRSNPFQRDPSDAISAVTSEGFDKYLERKSVADQRSAIDAEIKQLNRQKRDTVKNSDEYKAIEGSIALLKQQKEELIEVQVGLPQLGYSVIPQGTRLSGGFTLRNVNDNELTLFLLGMNRFASSPFMGGKRAHGCGRLSGEWDVSIRRNGGKMERAGKLSISGDFGDLSATGAVADWLDRKLDITQLDFTSETFSAKKPAKKASAA